LKQIHVVECLQQNAILGVECQQQKCSRGNSIVEADLSASNYNFLYTTTAIASNAAGGIAATIFEKTGSWTIESYGSAVPAMCAVLMAIVIQKTPFPRKRGKTIEAASPAAIRG
jgi:uncharacterized membrane protein